jgi:hypothetical protein
VVLVLLACAPPAIENVTPTANPTLPPIEITPIIEAPLQVTPITGPAQDIERVVFATRIEPDGAPVDERTVVPELPEMIYLCVYVRELTDDTRYRAYWFQDGQIIGQSDATVSGRAGQPGWVALRYRPIARLIPSATHEVELRVDDTVIDRYLFRVGVGALHDAISEAAFTSDFDIVGKPTDPRDVFNTRETQFTLKVRVSNQVDPSGMALTTHWFRGDAQIARVNPDPESPAFADPPNPRRFDFTFRPATRLTPGEYRVVLLLNGAEVRSIPFRITVDEVTIEPPPDQEREELAADPKPVPTLAPTATGVPQVAPPAVTEIVVTTSVDPQMNHPTAEALSHVEIAAGSRGSYWVAVKVRDLLATDVVQVSVWRDDNLQQRDTLDHEGRSSEWLAVEVQLAAPSTGQVSVLYDIEVAINGRLVRDARIQVVPVTPP